MGHFSHKNAEEEKAIAPHTVWKSIQLGLKRMLAITKTL